MGGGLSDRSGPAQKANHFNIFPRGMHAHAPAIPSNGCVRRPYRRAMAPLASLNCARVRLSFMHLHVSAEELIQVASR